jgi:hypothetical protein
VTALHSALAAALTLFGTECTEIVGFDDPLPEPRRQDVSSCFLETFRGPPPPGPSLESTVRFVDGEGGALRGELAMVVCPFQPPGEAPDCSTPLSTGATSGGALTVVWPAPPPMMMPPPMPMPGEMPPMPPTPPFVRVESDTYFPTIVLRRPGPADGAFWPDLPVFSREALEQTFEPDSFEPYLNERAHLIVVTYDCNGRPASDIEVLIDDQAYDTFTVPFARDGLGQPIYERKVSGDDGLVGYLNVATTGGRADPRVTVRDTRYDTEVAFRGSGAPVPLRKGHLTLLVLAL